MRKIAFLALSLVLTACILTACRRNTTGESSMPSETNTATQASSAATEPATQNTGSPVMPTVDLVPDGSEGGDATDGDGFIDDGTMDGGTGRMQGLGRR